MPKALRAITPQFMNLIADSGVLSFKDGRPQSGNPYSEGLLNYAWDFGWREAAYVSACRSK